MSSNIRALEPKELWNNFADLNAVPRPSKKEEKVIQFMKSFGEKLKLPVSVDQAGNVIIKKPASKGMENRETIVLQSHLDMVHQKNADTKFDFEKEGIKMLIDGDWVRAEGTTLGADNGIGVATIMTVLASNDIQHPAIEALFTIDEETGMTGALELKGGLLDGKIMLNLDTEDDKEITIGCAGGLDITVSGSYQQAPAKNKKALRLNVKGLSGGHSGMDIHLGRGNANKIMNRLLYYLVTENGAELASVEGGGLRNAIPRESRAVVVISESSEKKVLEFIRSFAETVKKEHLTTDPSLSITSDAAEAVSLVADPLQALSFIRSVYACPSGIYRMSADIAGLVQTSNNLARVEFKEGKFQALCLSRSSVDSEKEDIRQAITSAFELCGAKVSAAGGYPGWTPDPSSAILKLMTTLYEKKYNEKPHVSAVHAGLECGILGRNYSDMQMISFGPNIRGAHSPDERVQISSVQRYWDFFLDILKKAPLRK